MNFRKPGQTGMQSAVYTDTMQTGILVASDPKIRNTVFLIDEDFLDDCCGKVMHSSAAKVFT